MSYFEHLKLNWIVAFRSLIMFLFHFIHGVLPVKYTSHEFWKIGKNMKVKKCQNK